MTWFSNNTIGRKEVPVCVRTIYGRCLVSGIRSTVSEGPGQREPTLPTPPSIQTPTPTSPYQPPCSSELLGAAPITICMYLYLWQRAAATTQMAAT